VPFLADTNVVARWALPNDPQYATIRQAVFTLQARREILYITPQVLVEFHALATRPVEANGLGWTAAAARSEAHRIETSFPLLAEVDAIYPLWGALVDAYGIIGRQVYDARLVAVMQAHGISHILTLNGSHFQRFSGIVVVDKSLTP
jgi:predicted nucleic acid-binding protein